MTFDQPDFILCILMIDLSQEQAELLCKKEIGELQTFCIILHGFGTLLKAANKY